MNDVRRIVKNSGASFLAQVSTPASSFVLVFFIAKSLGAPGLGEYTSALSLLFLFQAFASLGLPYFITREVAQDKSKAEKFLVNASFMGSLFSFVMVGLMCLSVHMITDDTGTIHAAYILSFSLTPYVLALVCQSISRGFEKLEHIALSEITGNAVKLILGLFVLLNGYGLALVMLVILLSHFIIFFISLYFSFRFVRAPFAKIFLIDPGFCKWVVQAASVFALIVFVCALRLHTDVLILTKLMGETEVGYYSAALKLTGLVALGINCYIMAIQPVVFRLFESSPKSFEALCLESIRYLLIIILPIIAATTVIGDRFILFIFDREFLPSADALRIIIWLIVFFGFNQIFANALIAADYQKINLHANIAGMLGNLALNLLLIPYLGFMGAAVANVASAFITFCYQLFFVSRHLFKINYLHLALKPFAASITMMSALFFIREINLIALFFISLSVYFFSLLAIGTFSVKEILLIKRLLYGDGEVRAASAVE